MFAILLYHMDGRSPMVDRTIGHFDSFEEALEYAEQYLEGEVGQDFLILEIEGV